MGHYDRCYEAEERRQDEQRGLRAKGLIHKASDENVGSYFGMLDSLFAQVALMHGTAEQHRILEAYRKRHREFFK